jgi:hypothetical protein
MRGQLERVYAVMYGQYNTKIAYFCLYRMLLKYTAPFQGYVLYTKTTK